MDFTKVSRFLIKDGVEKLMVKTVGTYIWPPCSVAVLAEGDHDDFLALDVDRHHRLPGGLINAREDPKTAARREVKEETGFEVEIGELLDIKTSSGRNPGIHFFFRGKVTGGEKSGSWEGRPGFVPRKEIQDKVWKLEHSHIHEYLFP